jgi:transcription-repair coupling factor (superfamily II helicase)
VPAPKTAPLGGRPLRDQELLKWSTDLVEALFLPEPVGGKIGHQ